jgi:hypothetical protein
MRADFHADSTTDHRTKQFAYRFAAGADVAFLNHSACFVQNAVVARAISQIQTNREFRVFENLASASLHGVKLFHCRSPFPCASSALTIGSVTSRGDRPSHSISEVVTAAAMSGPKHLEGMVGYPDKFR